MNKCVSFLSLIALSALPNVALASDGGSERGTFAIASAIAIGLAAFGGTFSQSKAISSGLEAIGRNPAAQAKVFIPMLLGLALIESLVILAFVIANKLASNI